MRSSVAVTALIAGERGDCVVDSTLNEFDAMDGGVCGGDGTKSVSLSSDSVLMARFDSLSVPSTSSLDAWAESDMIKQRVDAD